MSFESDLDFACFEAKVIDQNGTQSISRSYNPPTPRALMTPGRSEGDLSLSGCYTPSTSYTHQVGRPRVLGLVSSARRKNPSKLAGRFSPVSSSRGTCSGNISWAAGLRSGKRHPTSRKKKRTLSPESNKCDADDATAANCEDSELQQTSKRQIGLPGDIMAEVEGRQVFVERGMGRDSAGNLGSSGLLGSFYGASSQQE
jgi:hypothetical protein